jgi:hypothetical protein
MFDGAGNAKMQLTAFSGVRRHSRRIVWTSIHRVPFRAPDCKRRAVGADSHNRSRRAANYGPMTVPRPAGTSSPYATSRATGSLPSASGQRMDCNGSSDVVGHRAGLDMGRSAG